MENLKQISSNSRQYELAIQNAEELNNRGFTDKTIYSGHSLGGGLANASALAFGGTSVTFNPAWVSNSTRKEYTLYNKNANIINHVVAGEILDVSQRTYGRKLGLYSSGKTNFLFSWEVLKPLGVIKSHGIDVVIDALKD